MLYFDEPQNPIPFNQMSRPRKGQFADQSTRIASHVHEPMLRSRAMERQQEDQNEMEARARHLQARLDALTAAWLDVVQQMECYEISFARRLATCPTFATATLECNRWSEHRIDTLKAITGQLFELWSEARQESHISNGNMTRSSEFYS